MSLFEGAGPTPITLEAQVEVAERELRYREWVYPKRVKEAKMAQREADQQLAGMRAIIRTLRGILESGERAPEPSRLTPGVLVELQTQAARGTLLQRHAKELLDAYDVYGDATSERLENAIGALRAAMKDMAGH